MKKESAFTLVEVMVVLILLAVLSAVAVPNYRNSLRRAHEKEMIRNLSILHEAAFIYHSRYGTFPESDKDIITVINDSLDTAVIATDKNYNYTAAGDPSMAFLMNAAWDSSLTTDPVEFSLDQDPLDNSNPCCVSGNCLLINVAC